MPLPKCMTIFNGPPESGPVEIMIYGRIGASYWDDSGISAKDITDELAGIPRDREILVRVNSEGGSVKDGLAIYNALKDRKDKTTCRIDGWAVSIASVFPLACGRVISPKQCVWMIHEPWSLTQGNAEDHRRAVAMLDAHAETLVSAYEEKTGKGRDEIRAAMQAETWLSGEAAVEWGLADESDDTQAAFTPINLSAFKNVPEHVKAANRGRVASAFAATRSAAPCGGAPKEDPMRNQIIALLKKHGVSVQDAWTDEFLMAELNKLVAAGKVTATEATAAATPPATVPAPQTAATVPAAPQNVVSREEFDSVRRQLEAQRRANVTAAVDAVIADRRIPSNQREPWINRAMQDESVLDSLRAMPQQPVPEAPLQATINMESMQDIGRHLLRTQTEACNSFCRGNAVDASTIGRDANQAALFYRQNRDRILPVLNDNTIGADLKRVVLLQEMLRAFKTRILPMRLFAAVFQNVPLQGTDEVVVPYFALVTTASTDYVAANGYVMGDSAQSSKKVTVNKRKYQPIRFSSQELSRTPAINLMQIGALKAEKLGVDVFTDVLSVITAATYGAAVHTGPASAFDSDDVVDIRTACNKANWPSNGRGLILDSDYDGNLFKDTAIKAAMNKGDAGVINNGVVPRILGFDYYECPSLPSNSENLKGVAVFNSGILIATAPITPTGDVRTQLSGYQVVTDPETGLSFEYRRWGNADYDQSREVVEANYGYIAGEAAAIKRIVES